MTTTRDLEVTREPSGTLGALARLAPPRMREASPLTLIAARACGALAVVRVAATAVVGTARRSATPLLLAWRLRVRSRRLAAQLALPVADAETAVRPVPARRADRDALVAPVLPARARHASTECPSLAANDFRPHHTRADAPPTFELVAALRLVVPAARAAFGDHRAASPANTREARTTVRLVGHAPLRLCGKRLAAVTNTLELDVAGASVVTAPLALKRIRHAASFAPEIRYAVPPTPVAGLAQLTLCFAPTMDTAKVIHAVEHPLFAV